LISSCFSNSLTVSLFACNGFAEDAWISPPPQLYTSNKLSVTWFWYCPSLSTELMILYLRDFQKSTVKTFRVEIHVMNCQSRSEILR
jgi:hypothetical protein